VPRDTDGVVQADALLGQMVAPTYSPPALVVEGVTLDAFPPGTGGDLGRVGRPASPRLGLIVSSGVVGPSAGLVANGELLTGHQTEEMTAEMLDSDADVSRHDVTRDGVVESL
jgi:hypothetical protein